MSYLCYMYWVEANDTCCPYLGGGNYQSHEHQEAYIVGVTLESVHHAIIPLFFVEMGWKGK